jgi:MYXO-CTERM domain-containing protein
MENVEPGDGFATMSPLLAYATGSFSATIAGSSGAVRAGGVATFTTTGDHRLRRGETVTVSGVGDGSFNGTFTIASVPSRRTFTVAQAGGEATSGGGTARPADYGNVVLGGTFYDATLFPAEYRQDFFFGDFGSGQMVRLETEADGTTLARAEQWGDDFDLHIDAATGPDGALYLAQHGGTITRVTYERQDVAVVVSPQNLRMNEGGVGVVGVRLTRAPGAPRAVTVAPFDGDPDVGVTGAATLSFNDETWETPQYVTLAAAEDGDRADDLTRFIVGGDGVAGETVTVRVTDQVGGGPPPADAGPADAGGAPDAGGTPDAGGAPDAGAVAPDAAAAADAGAAADARAGADAAVVPGYDDDGGCSCRAGPGPTGALGLLALLALRLRRRR